MRYGEYYSMVQFIDAFTYSWYWVVVLCSKIIQLLLIFKKRSHLSQLKENTVRVDQSILGVLENPIAY